MKKIIFLFFSLFVGIYPNTKLQNETIKGNKLVLKFTSLLNYSIKKEKNKYLFIISNFQDESTPGDVCLPSNEIFISLPFIANPKVEFSITSKKQIKAIPQFNDVVELKNDELIYLPSKNLANSKEKHFKIAMTENRKHVQA